MNKCIFCQSKLNVAEYRGDRNKESKAMVSLCSLCMPKLHRFFINPLLARMFSILIENRYTFKEVAEMFSTTKQNVFALLKRK